MASGTVLFYISTYIHCWTPVPHITTLTSRANRGNSNHQDCLIDSALEMNDPSEPNPFSTNLISDLLEDQLRPGAPMPEHYVSVQTPSFWHLHLHASMNLLSMRFSLSNDIRFSHRALDRPWAPQMSSHLLAPLLPPLSHPCLQSRQTLIITSPVRSTSWSTCKSYTSEFWNYKRMSLWQDSSMKTPVKWQ